MPYVKYIKGLLAVLFACDGLKMTNEISTFIQVIPVYFQGSQSKIRQSLAESKILACPF
jgi:hypothetical protein